MQLQLLQLLSLLRMLWLLMLLAIGSFQVRPGLVAHFLLRVVFHILKCCSDPLCVFTGRL